MTPYLAILGAVAFGAYLGWLARGERDKRRTVRRIRATLAENRDNLRASSASLRGALREGER